VDGVSASTVRSLTWRYHVLLALRFVPTGLMITVFVLLLQDRGLSLGEIGLGTAAQGLVMLVLELPSGGLADAVGRKPVTVVATLFSMAALVVLLVADTVVLLAAMAALQGIFRALDSGPLQSWFIDGLLADDAGADLERSLGRSDAVICGSLGAGALLSALLVGGGGALGLDPLEVPIVVALLVQAVGLLMVLRLVDERRAASGWPAVRAAVAQVPAVVRGGIGVVRASSLLTALVVAELLWGMGMVGFETFLPPRMAELRHGADDAVTILGPVITAAWLLSALGSALAPRLARRFGSARTGCALRVAHGVTVVAMGLAAGPTGLVVAYLATYWVHGATSTVHYSLVHRAVDGAHRATVISANSLTSQVGGAVGGIAIGALADATSIPTGMFVAAGLLAAAAPLYLAGRGAVSGPDHHEARLSEV
jgi:MFS family permease